MALNTPLRTQALQDMIAWVGRFDADTWFNYSTADPNKKLDVSTVAPNGTGMRYQRILRTTTAANDRASFMCYAATFTFPVHTRPAEWRVLVWVCKLQPDNPTANKLAALDGLRRFMNEANTYQSTVYADQYV